MAGLALVLFSASLGAPGEERGAPGTARKLTVPGETWQQAAEPDAPGQTRAAEKSGESGVVRPEQARPAPVELKSGGAWPHPLIELPAVSDAERQAARRESERSVHSLVDTIGFGRTVPERYAERVRGEDLHWDRASDGGEVAVIGLRSPGASALRVLLSVDALPEGSELRFYNPADPAAAVGPIGVAEVLADRQGEGAALYWSPIIEGDAIAVEVYVPPGTDPGSVQFGIPLISHLDVSPARVTAAGVGASGFCHVDVACAADAVSDALRAAVAKYTFTVAGGRTGTCSGTLLADVDPATQIPYFLTAHHCVSEQSEASTMQFHWFFERRGCDGLAPTSVVTTGGGAKILSRGGIVQHDYVFVRLNNSPAAGVGLSGWSTATFPRGYRAFGVHHPRGDLKKYSAATIDGYENWPNVDDPYPSHVKVFYDDQSAQGGSSGSGLFAPVGDTQYLIGVLTGGLLGFFGSGCPFFNTGQLTGYYGRFDRIYERARPWLGPPDFALNPGETVSASLAAALVDARGAFVGDLVDGATVDLSTATAEAFDVRLDNVDVADIASVRIRLEGPHTVVRTSNAAPHRLHGDGGSGALPDGAYRLRATPRTGFFNHGSARTGLDIGFVLSGGSTAAMSLTEFDLIDPVTEAVVQTIASGATLDVAALSTNRLDIRADSAGGTAVGSVEFSLTSPPGATEPAFSHEPLDNSAPFTLYGARGRAELLPAGMYRLTATPYPATNKEGTAGTALSVDFTVPAADVSPIASLQLIDGEDDEVVLTLSEGARLPREDRPEHFNISATLQEGQEVDSVALMLAGPFTIGRTEFRSPYSLLGDDGGNLRARRLRSGTFRVTAVPRVGGDDLRGLSLWFAVDRSFEELTTGEAIDRFELIERGATATTISNGEVLDMTGRHGNVNIRAIPAASPIHSVSMSLSGGGRSRTRVDTRWPYELLPGYGDLPNGEFELTATVFRGNDKDQLFGTKTVRFTVTGAPTDLTLTDSPVTGFSLLGIEAGAVTTTQALHDGDEIEVTGDATVEYALAAAVDADSGVETVLMELLHTAPDEPSDLTWRIVPAPGPYAVFGVEDGTYLSQPLKVGTYRLGATAYRNANLDNPWPRRFVDFAAVLNPQYDASLSDLALSGVSIGVFDDRRTRYVVDAPADLAVTTVTATTTQPGASVSILPADADAVAPRHQVALAFGPAKDIDVTVTSPNGLRSKTYTVAVDRLSDDATLSALSLSGIDIGTFDADTTEYTGTGTFDLEATTVTATPTYADATASISPVDARPGDSEHQVALAYGARTTLTIRVVAEDGTEKIYRVHVDRPALDDLRLTLDALSLSDIGIGNFSKFLIYYEGESNLGQATTTVMATPTDSDATVAILPADADVDLEHHQVALDVNRSLDGIQVPTAIQPGGASIAVTVTASDDSGDTATYRVEVLGADEGGLRLVDGEAPHQGRLEIWHEGRWGTICDDDWGTPSTLVACRQLGYSGAFGFSSAKNQHAGRFYFPSVDDKYWLDNVVCDGDEARVADCEHRGWGTHNCYSLEAIGVWCDPSPPTQVSITADAAPLAEGDAATFTLRRDGLADAALEVRVRVTESGAMLDGTPPDEVDFASLEHETVLRVATVNDTAAEAASEITAEVVVGNRYVPMVPVLGARHGRRRRGPRLAVAALARRRESRVRERDPLVRGERACRFGVDDGRCDGKRHGLHGDDLARGCRRRCRRRPGGTRRWRNHRGDGHGHGRQQHHARLHRIRDTAVAAVRDHDRGSRRRHGGGGLACGIHAAPDGGNPECARRIGDHDGDRAFRRRRGAGAGRVCRRGGCGGFQRPHRGRQRHRGGWHGRREDRGRRRLCRARFGKRRGPGS